MNDKDKALMDLESSIYTLERAMTEGWATPEQQQKLYGFKQTAFNARLRRSQRQPTTNPKENDNAL